MADSVDALLAALDSPDSAVRAQAARELAKKAGDDRAFSGLIRALYDPHNTAVTRAAMEGLLAVGTDSAIDALLAALSSDDEETADHLHTFLYVSNSPLAFEVLRRYNEGIEPQ